MFLLDATKDDLLTAIEVALLNAQVEDVRGDSYWQAVVDVLTSQQHEN
jgi:formylmethanofuran dehydrogenase subunit E-like metal-binding protein